MKAVFEMSQGGVTRRTCGRFFGSVHLPGGVGQKKVPTVAPQKAPFTLVSAVFVCGVEDRSKQTSSCGQCLTRIGGGRGGVPLAASTPHACERQTSLSDGT